MRRTDSSLREARACDFTLACICAVVGALSCGGSTEVGRTSLTDAGSGATANVGSKSTGGAANGGAGGAATGGTSAGTGGVGAGTGGSTGSGGSAGAPGSGGAAGQANLCLGPGGQLLSELKQCLRDSDCTTLQVPTCCGSDQVVGIHVGEHCTVPSIDCSGLGCAKFVYPMAEDGKTTEGGGRITAGCEVGDSGEGTCRSFVAAAVDAGTTPCGSQTCADNQVCALPPNNGPPPTGPAFCVDIPAGCAAPLQCSCFASSVCGGGALFCYSVTGHLMQCLFAP
jgi:hypothetical protein